MSDEDIKTIKKGEGVTRGKNIYSFVVISLSVIFCIIS